MIWKSPPEDVEVVVAETFMFLFMVCLPDRGPSALSWLLSGLFCCYNTDVDLLEG